MAAVSVIVIEKVCTERERERDRERERERERLREREREGEGPGGVFDAPKEREELSHHYRYCPPRHETKIEKHIGRGGPRGGVVVHIVDPES